MPLISKILHFKIFAKLCFLIQFKYEDRSSLQTNSIKKVERFTACFFSQIMSCTAFPH
nr:MAG TPA: hypothetical protein [Caudoviricetes sp.]